MFDTDILISGLGQKLDLAKVCFQKYLPISSIETTFKFVEDVFIFVYATKFVSQKFVYLITFYRPSTHIDIPDFNRNVVPGDQITSIVAKFNAGNT